MCLRFLLKILSFPLPSVLLQACPLIRSVDRAPVNGPLVARQLIFLATTPSTKVDPNRFRKSTPGVEYLETGERIWLLKQPL